MFEDITVVDGSPVGVPTDAEVARTEAQLGLKLPPSYLEFVRGFGYGRLGRLVLLFSPLQGPPETLATRSPGLAETLKEGVELELVEYEPDGSPELLQRLVPFGISENGHVWAWDPAEPQGAELPVYVLGTKLLSVTRAGADLGDAVDCLFDERVRRVLGPGYAPLPRTFEPSKAL